MTKVLFIATTAIHIKNFHEPYIKWLQSKGIEVHIACKLNTKIDFADKLIDIEVERSPFKLKNVAALKKIRKIVKLNNYKFIHGHTPMGGILARLSKLFVKKTKIIYTVHGFHFFKGSGVKNWLIYLPSEILFSFLTDAIITINEEDKKNIDKFFPRRLARFKINGIGVNKDRIELLDQIKKDKLKSSLGINSEVVVLYIAEFTPGKNHRWLIEQIRFLIKKNKRIKFLFAGGGKLKKEMEKLAKELGVDKNIIFLGYRKDIGNYISIADIGISVSKREGLPIGIAELSTLSLPVIVSNIRGHNELVENGKNGYIFELNDTESFNYYLLELSTNSDKRGLMGKHGSIMLEKYQVNNTLDQMKEIYSKYV